MTRLHQIAAALLALGSWNGRATAADPSPPAPAKFVIRMATAAPEGSSWARELTAYTQEVEATTHGLVRVKLYFGGIAGNELETAERVKRGQLDGVASGGMLCQQLSPSYRVMRVRGLFDSQEEAGYVLNRLKPIFDEEFKRSGYVHLGAASLGPDVVFSRQPVRSLADFRKQKLWRWNIDEPVILMDREMGLQVAPLPVEDAGRAFDEGQIDGFVAVPAAAVAFQWFSRTKYLTDLRLGFLWACIIVSNRAFERLPIEGQQAMLAATAKLGVRINEVGKRQDAALLGGLFQRQGMTELPVSHTLRVELIAAAKAARERLGEKLVNSAALQRAMAEIEKYRAEHPAKAEK